MHLVLKEGIQSQQRSEPLINNKMWVPLDSLAGLKELTLQKIVQNRFFSGLYLDTFHTV